MSDSIAFDRAAEFYDETRGFPPGADTAAVETLVRAGGFTGQERVLEFGVGTGRVALPLLPHVGQLVGIDLARPMMERLRIKDGGDRVALAEGDATRMPFAAASFDAVLSVHVLHLIPNWQAAVDEVARVLRPGAPYIHAWSKSLHRDSWWDAWNQATQRRDAYGFGVKAYEHSSFLDGLGWRLAGEEQCCAYTVVRSPREFLDQLRRRMWSSTWDVSDEDLAAGVAAVHEAMLREHDDLDTPVEHEISFFARAYLPPA